MKQSPKIIQKGPVAPLLIAAVLIFSVVKPISLWATGLSAIKVNEIKMEETVFRGGTENTVRKIPNPRFKISIKGGQAKQLLKILPTPPLMLMGSMTAKDQKLFKESFGGLVIYSEGSITARPKSLVIDCNRASMDYSHDTPKVRPKKQTECTISIIGTNDEGQNEIYDWTELEEFAPKKCN